jgi:hypothetical protein
MMGISAVVLAFIRHFLFTISRKKPKINLRRLIIKNSYAEEKRMLDHSERYSVSGNTLSFKSVTTYTTVFIKPVIMLVYLNAFRFSQTNQQIKKIKKSICIISVININ